ncbi:cell division protein [Herbaspirillum seropedicae]|uniref:cell division protein n=2 Tax=Herbaspirillum seropedicae TaxID=964 RepID=UPI0028666AF4|nr:cell division protein [Herbaspirillum seropedicae]MDR6397792.1 hypothetical protein [Herbaspirillum seropedicae]
MTTAYAGTTEGFCESIFLTKYFCHYRNKRHKNKMITPSCTRKWLVRWMYAAVAVHLLVGILLPLVAGAAPLASYHHGIERYFWGDAVPASARAQQIWWLSLFGPTVQAASIWMGVLLMIADKQRNAAAWMGLIAGLVVWGPQDMLISLQAHCSSHVWLDAAALLGMLPPLFWLFRHDLKRGKTI